MFYRKFPPSAHLAPFVECYFAWENQAVLTMPLRIESSLSGFGSMGFNFGDAYWASTAKRESLLASAAFVTGQTTQNYTLDLAGRIGMVGVVFKPVGLLSLFGLPMY